MNLKFSAALYLLVSALFALGAVHAKTPEPLKNFQAPELLKSNGRLLHASFSSGHAPELLDHSSLVFRAPNRPETLRLRALPARPKKNNNARININVGSTGNRSPPSPLG